jgi:hypothetical protein
MRLSARLVAATTAGLLAGVPVAANTAARPKPGGHAPDEVPARGSGDGLTCLAHGR